MPLFQWLLCPVVLSIKTATQTRGCSWPTRDTCEWEINLSCFKLLRFTCCYLTYPGVLGVFVFYQICFALEPGFHRTPISIWWSTGMTQKMAGKTLPWCNIIKRLKGNVWETLWKPCSCHSMTEAWRKYLNLKFFSLYSLQQQLYKGTYAQYTCPPRGCSLKYINSFIQ